MASGFISDSDIQKVREASDLVSVIGERVPLKQRGHEFWCVCPFHSDKNPSLRIDTPLQLWHCFGCHEGGDVFGFIMKWEDMSFPEAVRYLAERAHIELSEEARRGTVSTSKKARLKEVCAKTAEFYHTQLMRSKDADADTARKYLSKRGLGGEVPKTWNLGFAPGKGKLVRYLSSLGFSAEEMIEANVATKGKDGSTRDRFYNRVMFPISDVQGDYIAFGGRVIDGGEPKYLNSQETPIFHKSSVLYGLDKAKASMASTGDAIIVEGYTDVITLSEAGISNVVATLGTALTMQHIHLLSKHAKKRIVYLFDGDNAGQRAAERALSFINEDMTPEKGRMRVDLCAVTLPDDLDPADFVAQRGADALRELISGAQPLLKYGIDRKLSEFDLDKPEGRSAALTAALKILAPIKDSLLAQDYAREIASRTRMREEEVVARLSKLSKPKTYQSDGEPEGTESAVEPAPATHTALTTEEISRRRYEQELLCTLAQKPMLALEYADRLSSIEWHESIHSAIAQAICDCLVENLEATPADIVTFAQGIVPSAMKVLTSVLTNIEDDCSRRAEFLFNELHKSDLEDTIACLKSRLAAMDPNDGDSYENMFESVVRLQKELAEMKITDAR